MPIQSSRLCIHVHACSDVKTTDRIFKQLSTVKSQLHSLCICQRCRVGISDVSEAFSIPGKESESVNIGGSVARPVRSVECGVWSLYFTLYHSTLYTLHFANHTLNSPHSGRYTPHFTPHPHTTHSTLYTLHSALYTSDSALHTARFTLYTPDSTLYTPHSLYKTHFTHHTFHIITIDSTLYTLHSTLYT